MSDRFPAARGAALVIALAILGLLVLVALSLGAAVRLRLESAHAATRRAQARDHASAALEMARAQLEAWVGPETRVTGPGASGMPTAPAFRGPAQVWTSDGAWIGELSSGRGDSATDAPRLVVATAVAGGRGPLEVQGVRLSGDAGSGWGGFAVFDEGAKLPLRTSAAETGGIRLRSSPDGPLGVFRPLAEADPALVRRLVTFGQLALVVAPSLVRAAEDEVVLDSAGVPGRLTVNTDSPAVWQAILETAGLPPGDAATAAVRVAASVAAFETDGKARMGPFTTIAAVRAFLVLVLPEEPEAEEEAWARIEPFLAVRSETFRVRAVGAVDGPGEPGERTVARLEATMRRNGAGGGFVVTGFRWLAPDDP